MLHVSILSYFSRNKPVWKFWIDSAHYGLSGLHWNSQPSFSSLTFLVVFVCEWVGDDVFRILILPGQWGAEDTRDWVNRGRTDTTNPFFVSWVHTNWNNGFRLLLLIVMGLSLPKPGVTMMCDVSRLRDYVTGGTFPLCRTWCALQCLFDAILLLRWHLPTLSHLMWAVVLVWWNILQSTCCWGENIFSTLLLATRWVLSRVRSAAISRPLIGHWSTPPASHWSRGPGSYQVWDLCRVTSRCNLYWSPRELECPDIPRHRVTTREQYFAPMSIEEHVI